ncbi:cell wall-binding repeat-containing protein [Agromyces sp. SYSU K20354]|uniref:cell wall-binding repeat-containing protein n=1 Tax=Agromyces cavernae TaxID=2898659 RepID=UPI001E433210|nr:cell wall-binding repeat-containing protein [Agromyces cavernae]MCD2441119.1 cell wall-binding repeat-containing protein [Agromyces cavernae]
MTRTPSGVRWRAATAALALCGLLAAGATPAFADDEVSQLRLPAASDTSSASVDATDDPLDLLRADPREDSAPVRLDTGDGGFVARSATATGSISGTVTYTDITTKPLKPLATGYVEVQDWDDARETYVSVASAKTSATGAYTVTGVPAGTYLLAFFDDAPSGLKPEFWKDAPVSGWATEVTLADGEAVTGIDERLEPMLTGYIAGTDRYATSAAISREGFPADAPCVYIASGANFPDALSAGPAAATCGGPLLLVAPNAIPAVVAAELDRLNPAEIVIAGGTGAVSSAVQTKLKAYSPVVRRIAGVDRYDTSRKIVADAFDASQVVWVATGANFPDALAASAAAALENFPVMIVPGTASRIDAASKAALTALNPQVVAIAGGTGVVSAGIRSSIYEVASVQAVARLGGVSRYETASIINSFIWDPAQSWSVYAWLVNGTKFPDALSGAALVGRHGGPMHVVPPTCTPAPVADHIAALDVYETYLLGYFGQLSSNGKPFKLC